MQSGHFRSSTWPQRSRGHPLILVVENVRNAENRVTLCRLGSQAGVPRTEERVSVLGGIRDLRTGYGPVCVTNFYRINILFTADHDLQTIFHVLGVYNPPEVMVVVVSA